MSILFHNMRRPPIAAPPYDPSRDRQRLDQLLEELRSIVQAFCDHRPLLRGRVARLSRRCGKSGCRCSRGKLHQSTVLVDRSGPRRKLRTLLPQEYRQLRHLTQPYRTLRRLRARVPHLSREALICCDRLLVFRLRAGILGSSPLGRPSRHG